jgi:hypothetical protein
LCGAAGGGQAEEHKGRCDFQQLHDGLSVEINLWYHRTNEMAPNRHFRRLTAWSDLQISLRHLKLSVGGEVVEYLSGDDLVAGRQ